MIVLVLVSLTQLKSHVIELLHDVPASRVVFCPHRRNLIVTAPERRDRRVLARRRGAHDAVLVNLRHLLHDPLRSRHIAKAPARHRIGLGEAIDQDRPLLHAGYGGDGDVGVPRVGELPVDLIGENVEVVLFDDRGQGLQILSLHDRTGRVVRIGEDEELGLRRDGRLELVQLDNALIIDRLCSSVSGSSDPLSTTSATVCSRM